MKFLNFISIAFISNVYSKILTLEEEDQSLFNLTGKIIEAFFVDQESVTIFNVDKSLELREQESSVAKVIQGIAPVMIYDELCDELAVKISDMGEELDLPSTTKSYLLTTASIDLMTKYLPLFAKINTNGKWIFAMIDIKQSEIESILVKAWVEHHMANIVVLMFFEDEMRVMSFNPFELHNNKHGTFWSPSEVTSENLSDILEKLEDIFDGKVRNLQNYQLFATRFLEISEHNKILDKEMMKVFETTLNTKFVLTSSLDGEYHGNRLDNGSFTGSIRMVEKGLTDIAMNNRLMSPMESTNCAFLNPAGETSMKYVMKKSPQASTFLQFHLIQAFDKKTGIFYALTSIIFILVLLFSSVFKRKFMKRFIIDDVSMTLLMTVGIQCSVSMPLKKKTSAQRILIISLVVFSLITCNAYQGTIVSNLSRPVASKGTIDTLEQLLQSNLNLTVLTSLPDIFSSNDDESNVNRIQKLLHQRQIINHTMKVEEVDKILLNKENQAVLMREQFSLEMMNEVFDNETGEDLFHVVDESPVSYYLTYIVPKSSPFIRVLNMAVFEAREFGFKTLAWKKYKNFLERSKVKRYRNLFLKKNSGEAITIGNMMNIFIFYGICCGVCCAIFVVEICFKRYSA